MAKLMRKIVLELSRASLYPAEKSLAKNYILSQFNKYKVTDQQLCKAAEEKLFLGKTYLCYLTSLRRCAELQEEFHGKGERTVRETADLVGFKLPIDPK